MLSGAITDAAGIYAVSQGGGNGGGGLTPGTKAYYGVQTTPQQYASLSENINKTPLPYSLNPNYLIGGGYDPNLLNPLG